MKALLIIGAAASLASCAKDTQCNPFRDWGLTSCTAAVCPTPLDLSGGVFGTNTLTMTFGDGAVCTYQMLINAAGSDTSQGSGNFNGSFITGNATQSEIQACAAINGVQFDWSSTCSELTLTNPSGVGTYN